MTSLLPSCKWPITSFLLVPLTCLTRKLRPHPLIEYCLGNCALADYDPYTLLYLLLFASSYRLVLFGPSRAYYLPTDRYNLICNVCPFEAL
ncbi:hypothetical protein THIOM_001478 [Candidatus Thiomargarita nelsonii]|uniref:Uncharacterized protein n=1 Tax=Candidatus Thiomargarita nelsonii TaxID=1003181 RepID=A0A176S462_9GAMM|nr:hypothetical protein THIOM_001478 [Candidatus Thiomargarita nelsonii]